MARRSAGRIHTIRDHRRVDGLCAGRGGFAALSCRRLEGRASRAHGAGRIDDRESSTGGRRSREQFGGGTEEGTTEDGFHWTRDIRRYEPADGGRETAAVAGYWVSVSVSWRDGRCAPRDRSNSEPSSSGGVDEVSQRFARAVPSRRRRFHAHRAAGVAGAPGSGDGDHSEHAAAGRPRLGDVGGAHRRIGQQYWLATSSSQPFRGHAGHRDETAKENWRSRFRAMRRASNSWRLSPMVRQGAVIYRIGLFVEPGGAERGPVIVLRLYSHERESPRTRRGEAAGRTPLGRACGRVSLFRCACGQDGRGMVVNVDAHRPASRSRRNSS